MTGPLDAASVAVVGMGYVGTSLAPVLAESGFDVRGIDVDTDRVDLIEAGESPIEEARIRELFEQYAADGRITATDEFDAVAECETVVVTVGTPLAASDPDLSAVEAASASIGDHLVDGQAVIYRSTLPAGTTAETIRPILEDRSGLEVGSDVALAFCPERMAEGSAYDDLTTTPVVVGGVTNECGDRVTRFWRDAGLETISVSSPTAAEFVKLADNWWIDLNIALANEVALLSEQLGVDAMEVIEAANTLEKGGGHVNILYPGAGVGGSCLVKDPWFVANLGDEVGVHLETPRVSRRVNERMPHHVVELLQSELPDLTDRRVAVLGYAFKAGTDDTRNTPAKIIVDELQERGATVSIADPYVPAATVRDETGVEPEAIFEAVSGVDAIVLVTDHAAYRDLDPGTLVDRVGRDGLVVVDGRNAFASGAFEGEPVRYLGVGRGRRD